MVVIYGDGYYRIKSVLQALHSYNILDYKKRIKIDAAQPDKSFFFIFQIF